MVVSVLQLSFHIDIVLLFFGMKLLSVGFLFRIVMGVPMEQKIYNIRICNSQFAKTTYARQSLVSSGIVAFILICLKANSQNWKYVGDTCQRKKMLGTLAREKKCWGHSRFLFLVMIIEENFCIPNIEKGYH